MKTVVITAFIKGVIDKKGDVLMFVKKAPSEYRRVQIIKREKISLRPLPDPGRECESPGEVTAPAISELGIAGLGRSGREAWVLAWETLSWDPTFQ
jgi:hypothetical protein